MTEEHKNTGVDQGPDAGGQEEEFNLEDILFGKEDTGVNQQTDAGSEEGAEQTGEGEKTEEQQETPAEPKQTQEGGETQLSEDEGKAFAAKWAAKKDELRQEIVDELNKRSETTKQEQEQGAPKHRDMSEDDINKLAEDLDASPQLVKLLNQVVTRQNQLDEMGRRQAQAAREQAEYSEAQQYVQELKQQNPSIPEWDDKALHDYRIEHYKKHQTVLPWKEAYKMALADAVVSGNITRQAQQEAIENIQKREKDSGTLKSSSTRIPTIDELPLEQFEQLAEDVKAGKYKRS